MQFSTISATVDSDLQAVNQLILASLNSPVEMIQRIGHYLINSGGKRVRPLVVLLSGKACQAQGEGLLTMAAVIEFIHTATLLHDDVVDGSKLRRGHLTAHQVWDSASAILVGDFLYSRAFQMMVSLHHLPAMRILADATNKIAEGEVLQLAHRHHYDVTEENYLHVIELKTAKLFEAAAQLGGLLGTSSPEIEKALATFGRQLGIAFQLVDDALDYSATNAAWGKNMGTDLAEGKMTLPLIYALKNASPALAQEIRQRLREGDVSNLGVIQEALTTTGALNYTFHQAQSAALKAKSALEGLPPSSYREALFQLIEFAISRDH